MTSTLEYLQTVDALARKAGHGSIASWLLQHGRRFAVKQRWPRSVPLKRGKLKEAYRNAAMAVLHDPDRFIYCEGYANGYIPVQHAWVYDRYQSMGYDITWADVGDDYIGIPFSNEYVNERLIAQKEWGILADRIRGEPPKGGPDVWEHPAFRDVPRDLLN